MSSSKGKATEKKLTAYLKLLMKDPDWWFHRFPDAGACMGRLQKQPADYIIMHKGVSALAEIKECNNRTSIPKARLTQLPKIKRFEMAGGTGLFIISHPDTWEWQYFTPTFVDEFPDRKSVPLVDLEVFADLREIFTQIRDRKLIRLEHVLRREK